MRRIQKNDPPRNVSPETRPPQRFTEAEKAYARQLADGTVTEKYARAAFDQLDKEKLRQQLLVEQKGLCVYCENRVRKDRTLRIDHWHPLSLNLKVALCWKNLYLSCHVDGSCDTAKRDQALNLPWPTEFEFERHIGFFKDGRMFVRTDSGLDAATQAALTHAIEKILCLNSRTLVRARESEMDNEYARLDERFPERRAAAEERERIVALRLQSDPLPAFVSARIAAIRSHVRRAK